MTHVFMMIFSIIFIWALYFISMMLYKKGTKVCPEGEEYVGTASFTAITYCIISVIVLAISFYSYMYMLSNTLLGEYAWVKGGVLLVIFLVVSGFVIKIIYMSVLKISKRMVKPNSDPLLISEIKQEETQWFLVCGCIIMGLLSQSLEGNTEMFFVILSVILGKFFWIESSFKDVFSIKNIPLSYSMTLAIIILISVVHFMFEKYIYSMTLGLVLGIISLLYYHCKSNNK